MIRILINIFLFILLRNFNYLIDNLLIFSLINIAFYSFLKKKKIDFFDFIIFILSTYLVEVLLDCPLFHFSSVILIILFIYELYY